MSYATTVRARVPANLAARIDAAGARLAPGVELTRSQAVRALLAKGVEAVEAQHRQPQEAPAAP